MSTTHRGPKKTFRQLARDLGVEEGDVMKAAARVLKLETSEARDPQFKLTPHEYGRIIQALGLPQPTVDVTEPEPEPALAPAEALPELRDDPRSPVEALKYGDLNHALWVHEDVIDTLEGRVALQKRLGIVLQHLGAHGRTTTVKGCSDEANRGWLRSPLGGHDGVQFYLWWAHRGSRPLNGFDVPEGAIVVRAVRHHDEHAALTVGEARDYLPPFSPLELEDGKLVESPWTEDQLRFIDDNSPVRLMLGRPGSGKTTVLWRAVEARAGQSVLYLTWSPSLAESARERFATFAPMGVTVHVRDFMAFLSEVVGKELTRQTLASSQGHFMKLLDGLDATLLKSWAERKAALFAEVRAHVLGGAVPGDEGGVEVGSLVGVSEDTYRARRSRLGAPAADALFKVLRALGPGAAFAEVFPELEAASAAIGRLRQDKVPLAYSGVDRVVIDEVQDLTLLEVTVFVELCRAIARKRGHAPWVLIAGDDGQTVRPSGFEWGRLNDLIARRIGTPRKFRLDDNLRCPTRIASVIERASAKYAHLSKGARPTKQGNARGSHHVDAHLLHVEVASHREANALLESLEGVEGVAVLTPRSEVPAWVVAQSSRDLVMTPAISKGREFQSVVVLDPGRLLASLNPKRYTAAPEFEEHTSRMAIDQLRVALSRATENLIFVDVAATEEEHAMSRALLGDPAPLDPKDLAEHLTRPDTPVEERILARTEEARAGLDENPRRAWRCALQAVRLLGDPRLPNGIADEAVRAEAHTTLIATAARLLVDGVPNGVLRADLVEVAHEALAAVDSPTWTCAFDQLDAWTSRQATSPIALLDAALVLHPKGPWLHAALIPKAQTLRQGLQTAASSPTSAARFVGNVAGWLAVTDFPGDTLAEVDRLRRDAFDTLIAAHDLTDAEHLLQHLRPPDPQHTGRLREAQGRHTEAAQAFERAARPHDALRNWRLAGQWEHALPLTAAGDPEHADLAWLCQLHDLLQRRPDSHLDRLTEAEAARLRQLALHLTAPPTPDPQPQPPTPRKRPLPRRTVPPEES